MKTNDRYILSITIDAKKVSVRDDVPIIESFWNNTNSWPGLTYAALLMFQKLYASAAEMLNKAGEESIAAIAKPQPGSPNKPASPPGR